MGKGVVRRLVKNGRNAVICDLNEEKGSQLASELGSSAAFVRTNVADESDVRTVVILLVYVHLHAIPIAFLG